MIRKEIFSPNEYYHVYSRTMLHIPEFRKQANAKRLARAFLLANSTNSTRAFEYLRNNEKRKTAMEEAIEISQDGKKMVDVLCYVIMPDHYHLLLQEKEKHGIREFMRKCNTSIATYINKKQNRKGSLFERSFGAKHIDSNRYLLHLSTYIHLNPLDFIESRNWRRGDLKSWSENKDKLLAYPWSSLNYFLNDNSKDRVVSGTEIILEQFNDRKEYEKFLQDWSEANTQKIKDFV